MNNATVPPGRSARRGIRRPGLWACVLVLVGIAAHWPSIDLGFYADDVMHQTVLAQGGVGTMRPPFGLYDFGQLSDYDGLVAPGGFPWWTDPDWKIRFCRPLSSASLALDHALWGDEPFGYHITSLAAFALCSWLVWTTLLGLGVSSGTALATLACFVLARVTVLPVGWIANRNEVLALIGVLAALSAITRHASWGRTRATVAMLSSVAFALGTKESGVVAPLVVIAWLMLSSRRPPEPSFASWARRVSALLIVVIGAYGATLMALGYGEQNVFYVTPWKEPVAALGRYALLVTAGWSSVLGLLPLDALAVEPRLAWPLGALFAAAVWFVGRAIAPTVRSQPAVGFALVWWLVALAPQAGAPPSDRLLFGALVPGLLLLATFVTETLSRPSSGRRSRRLAWFFVATAGGLSALTQVPMQLGMNSLARDVFAAVPQTEVGPPELGRREVFVLQVTDPMTALSFAPTWMFTSDDEDLRFWLAQGGRRGLRLTRTGTHTVEIESLNEPFAVQPFEIVYRTSSSPPEVGHRWRTDAFEVTALLIDAGGVRRARFEFDLSLEDPRHRWVTWNGTTYGSLPIPEVGETLEVPTFDPPNPFAP